MTEQVPCGKCPNCLKRRTSGWSFRLMEQVKVSKSAWFITLTYDTDHVPLTKNGFMSLDKKHLQLFFKRLRKAHEGNGWPSIKYYAAGEYGSETRRPHYHIILMNVQVEKIQSAWALGHVDYGYRNGVAGVNEATVGYTLKYISKAGKFYHRNDDRVREFALMSKGLGESYVGQFTTLTLGRLIDHDGEECVEIKKRKVMIMPSEYHQWHHEDPDERMYCNLTGGKVIGMPRYFKQKIYTEEQRKRIAFFARQKMLLEQEEQMKDPMYHQKQLAADVQAFRAQEYKNSKRDKI